MQEHPIPQDITGYRFHIIGSMTLKQFGEILLGVLIAVVFYNTNLIAGVKWFLIAVSVGLGAAAAFLPIEERPLDHWIITFFRAMYRPTKFYWKRVPHIPEIFTFKPNTNTQKEEPTLDLTPARRQRIKEYINTVPEVNATKQEYSDQELASMQNILASFSTTTITQEVTIQKQEAHEKPNMGVRVRKMRPQTVQEVTIFEDVALPELDQQITTQQSLGTVYEDKPIKIEKRMILSNDQVAQNIQIPTQETIAAHVPEQEVVPILSQQGEVIDNSQRSYLQPEAQNTVQTIASEDASYNQELPFPLKPTEPNKVVGMVLNKNNELITNAIVEIQTLEGNIARAVKTNALGQFFITTTLKPGDYNIIIEKDGFQFQPKHLKIDDTIIPPIEIRSEN